MGDGYDNTDIGRIVRSLAQAYAKIVTEMGGIQLADDGSAQVARVKTFTKQTSAAMHKTAASAGDVIRRLPPPIDRR